MFVYIIWSNDHYDSDDYDLSSWLEFTVIVFANLVDYENKKFYNLFCTNIYQPERMKFF